MALRYEDSERYYSRFGRKVFAFCDAAELPRDRILGVGIAIQGSPTPDGTQVMHGRILLDTGLRVENFARHLNLPCRLIHDVKAAALAELWSSDSIQNALFLFLGQYLGGILILGRNIIGEKTVSGTDVLGGFIEHMTLYPGGDDCYCGRKGCVSAYCSGYTLLDGSQASLDSFFAGLHSGNKSAMRKWKAFLDSLAIATGSMHMMMNCDIILGGSISPFLRDDDIERLKSKMHGCEKLPLSDFFVKRAQTNGEGVACGAALPFIEQFLHSIFL